MTQQLIGETDLTVNKFWDPHGAQTDLRRRACSIDVSGSVSAVDVPGTPDAMTEYLVDDLGVITADGDDPTVVYPRDERWLRGMIRAMRAFYAM